MLEETAVNAHQEPPPGSLAGRISVSWVAPPGWDAAPAGYRPGANWEPDPYWPTASPDWLYWRIDGPPDVTAHFTVDEPYVEAVKRWVPAPGWPTPRAGFMPADDWDPDPRWPPAPPNWQFWHVTDEAQDDATLARVKTRSGRLAELNRAERMLAHIRFFRADVPRLEAGMGTQPRTLSALLRRKTSEPGLRELGEMCSAAIVERRDALVDALAEDRPVGDRFLELDRRLRAAVNGFLDARTAAEQHGELARPGRFAGPGVGPAVAGQGLSPGITSDWAEAEHLAAAALVSMGFADARVTGPGTDGGVDVRGRTVVAQVKYLGTPVGRPVLQQLIGAAGGARPVCFSRNGFTKQASAYAQEAGIALFIVTLPGQVSPVNSIAAHLADRRN